MENKLRELVEKLEEIDGIEAAALSGSQEIGNADKYSNYNLDLYLSNPETEGEELDLSFLDDMNIDQNCLYPQELSLRLEDGRLVQIHFWNLEELKNDLEVMIDDGRSEACPTTKKWDNLLASRILFDKTMRLRNLQEWADCIYNEDLKEDIIDLAFGRIAGKADNLQNQIIKAASRKNDLELCRLSFDFFETYLEAIFALNETTYPSGSNIVELASRLHLLPKDFKENIDGYFKTIFIEPNLALRILDGIIKNLKELMEKENQ